MALTNANPTAPTSDPDARVQPRPVGCLIPLTAVQRLIWDSGVPLKRQCAASLRIVGELNEPLLRRCVEIVVARHEALRTRIVLRGETPRQEVIAAPDLSFEVIDLRAQGARQAPEIAARLTQEFVEAQLDLGADPFSTTLLRSSDVEHVLLIGIDHMVADGASLGIVRKEIVTLYRQGMRASHTSLPRPAVQFGDYAIWQQQTFEAWRDLHEHYWRERLARVPRVALPFDGAEPEQRCWRWTMTKFALGKDLSANLRLIALRKKMMLPLLVLGLVTAAVSRWCGRSEWAVDVTSHGRHGHPELFDTVGWLSTTLQLHFEIEKEDSLLHLVERIHLEYAAAIQHQDYGRLADCMPICTAPLSFNWPSTQWSRPPASAAQTGLDRTDITPLKLYPSQGQLAAPYRKLEFLLLPDDDTVDGTVFGIVHQAGLLTARTLEGLGDTIRLVGEAFVADPLVKHGALSLAW